MLLFSCLSANYETIEFSIGAQLMQIFQCRCSIDKWWNLSLQLSRYFVRYWSKVMNDTFFFLIILLALCFFMKHDIKQAKVIVVYWPGHLNKIISLITKKEPCIPRNKEPNLLQSLEQKLSGRKHMISQQVSFLVFSMNISGTKTS